MLDSIKDCEEIFDFVEPYRRTFRSPDSTIALRWGTLSL